MKGAIYGGVNAAVLTAMKADLSLDLDRMAKHCRWLLANGCNSLGVHGTTSEANSLGITERVELLEGLVERGIPAARMLPGVGTTAIPDTVLLVKKAASLGCPGVLMLPPFYYKNPSEDGLFAYFSEVIERAGGGIKVYLYHFPQQSAVPVSYDLVARLIRAYPGTVRGVKDSSGDFAQTKGYIDRFAKDGFEVYAGDDATFQATLRAGGAGCITAASNVSCAVAARLYANPNSDADQAILARVRQAVISAPLIPALKALVARHTGDAGWNHVRPPFAPLSAEESAKLFALFDASGIILAKAA